MITHRPPHLYRDNTWYMLTATTLDRAPLLAAERAKTLVRDRLRALAPEFGISLKAWVILDNHYHLLLKTSGGRQLPGLINRLHGGTARQINLWHNATGRTVWYSYWDTCIRDERGFWTRFNYIHYNPVKHGYTRRPGDWPFSSYGYYARTRGEAWLRDVVQRYPVRAADLDEQGG